MLSIRIISWALIFILTLRFPPGKSFVDILTFQEFVMVLMKLRLNTRCKTLHTDSKFLCPQSLAYFQHWLIVMDIRLSPLIYWPERQQLWETMPLCFKEAFGKKVTVIIDCFEVFIDRPTNLLARAQTFSSYKHHNTIKILISITPQATIGSFRFDYRYDYSYESDCLVIHRYIFI